MSQKIGIKDYFLYLGSLFIAKLILRRTYEIQWQLAGENGEVFPWSYVIINTYKVKGKFYRTTIRLVMLYGSDVWE